MITAAVLQHKSVVSNLDNLLKQGWQVQNFIYLFILSIWKKKSNLNLQKHLSEDFKVCFIYTKQAHFISIMKYY